jgi:lipopolysaccharide biosynthesis glycosyltransferase
MRTCHVAFCLDLRYVRPATVAAYSLVKHFGAEVPDAHLAVHFVQSAADDESARLRARGVLERVVRRSPKKPSVHWHELEPCVYASPVRYISSATQLRLQLPRLFAPLIPGQRLLYLDSDVAVLRDVAPLFFEEWTLDASVAARPDPHSGCMRLSGWRRPDRELFPADRRSFNAGVLVLRPDVMIARGFDLYCEALLSAAPLNDQVVLNWFALDDGGYHELPYGDNAVPSPWLPHEQHEELRSTARVVHWAHFPKPWSASRMPLADLWHSLEAELGKASRRCSIAA